MEFTNTAIGMTKPVRKKTTKSGGTFFGPNDFRGSFAPAPTSKPRFGGRSTFDGAVIFFNLPRKEVAKVIPNDFQLATKKSVAPDVHPVLLMLSHHANMEWLLPGPDPDWDRPYEELILMVPFVRHNSGSKWHSFVVRMYLNDTWAIKLGNEFYGYAKQRGSFARKDIELAPSEFKTFKNGNLYFEADLVSTGPWRSSDNAEATLPNYRAMQTIISMPLLGQFHPIRQGAAKVCSYWRWDYSTAFVRPMKSRHRFVRPFVKEMDSWVRRDPISSVGNGAIALRSLDWRLKFLPFKKCRYK